jgi:hypothetical protein
MNNEPVAWTDGKGNYFDKHSFFPVNDLTPLYTHPVKTLTDEEIKAVYGEYFDIENCDWLHLQCIQAILRKAQEK